MELKPAIAFFVDVDVSRGLLTIWQKDYWKTEPWSEVPGNTDCVDQGSDVCEEEVNDAGIVVSITGEFFDNLFQVCFLCCWQ